MGYSEIACQICGMSFNVGRLRKTTEPRSAGWDSSGYGSSWFNRRHSDSSRFCPESAGCMVVRRMRRGQNEEKPEDAIADEEGEDEDEDEDYMAQSFEETDPYEYNSQHESEPEANMEDDDENDDVMSCSSESSEKYRAFVQSLAPVAPPERLIPEHEAPEDDDFEYEHLAGGLECKWLESCVCEGAYNGHAISAEEMRGCTTLQCLVPKGDDWESEDDDEEFEKSGKFFLSGLSDHSPSRDMSWPQMFPPRHDCSETKADNTFYVDEWSEEYAMPFHPTCLEVFKRASVRRSGSVDYEGLINWWIIEAGHRFHGFPRDPAVTTEQWFLHVSGNEFVAANPCFGTKMESMLAASDRTGDPGFVYDTPVFGEAHRTSSDVFAQLPRELCFLVLDQLQSRDIANLRLVSRSFHQLPQSFFRSLTLREMPWLWEAWCDMDYSKWAFPLATELRHKNKTYSERLNNIILAQNALKEEARAAGDEDLHQAAIQALQQVAAEEEHDRDSLATPPTLQAAEKTDWYHMRCELARNNSRLLGLRNRRRIWKDCQEILDRISRYRGEGIMTPGQIVSAREVAEEARRQLIESNRRWHNFCQAGRPGTYNFDDWA
ncbi:hypothetical protein BJ166DRAFT_520332 [Pestalotiopsis sp. NC0098]|nr:hypothetical protein BJ166DRAFT_520332 [Pestalotiopsis sp. NC0098]